jgi:hypothetical protein
MSTTTATRAPRQRKPRPKPERRIGVALPFNAEGKNAVVNITVGKESHSYTVDRIPADWGQAFEVAKFGTEDRYHVNIDGEQKTCSCKGHTHHGHCKHADGLAALVKAGKL